MNVCIRFRRSLWHIIHRFTVGTLLWVWPPTSEVLTFTSGYCLHFVPILWLIINVSLCTESLILSWVSHCWHNLGYGVACYGSQHTVVPHNHTAQVCVCQCAAGKETLMTDSIYADRGKHYMYSQVHTFAPFKNIYFYLLILMHD